MEKKGKIVVEVEPYTISYEEEKTFYKYSVVVQNREGEKTATCCGFGGYKTEEKARQAGEGARDNHHGGE